MESYEENGPDPQPEIAEDELSRELRVIKEARQNVGEAPEIEIKKGRKPSEDITIIDFSED